MKNFSKSIIGSTLCNVALAYIIFMIARIIFFIVNFSYFAPYMSTDLALDMLNGALRFDTTALLYTNGLYIIMALIPLHLKENKCYYKATKIIYMFLNGIALAVNLIDTVYFQFTGRRSTATVFNEFSNEGNIASIFLKEFFIHWYLVAIFLIILWTMWKMYQTPKTTLQTKKSLYYIKQSITFIIVVALSIIGIRGGVGKAVRPITISNANQYVNRPIETSVVLNTPFSIIRTIGKKAFETPSYMSDEEMVAIYSPIHMPDNNKQFKARNVVVLILESFGKEYSAWLNRHDNSEEYPGYMPFIDSIAQHSITYRYSFSNGRKSIDGMPSVLSGIPMFIEPFFLTPASLNKVSGIAGELNNKNYYTAFFHGAPNGSMGFEAFARATGFKDYYGMSEYKADGNRYSKDDYDGTWAIWDEEFLQFYADKMATFKQPFMTAVFTASSHHPFVVPERYKNSFAEGKVPLEKCISYSDMALQKFFDKAKTKNWYNNTLFVITADHTNESHHSAYKTDLGLFEVPVIFYAPGDTTITPAYHENIIAQQIDIMPTVLGYLGYDKPYVSFGINLFKSPAHDTFAVNYNNGIYQFIKGDFLLQFDGQATIGMYNIKTDRLLKNNLIGTLKEQHEMEHFLKAVIQQYMQRMNNDKLVEQ